MEAGDEDDTSNRKRAAHPFNSVLTSVLATASVVLQCLAGTSCSFLRVQAAESQMLQLLDGVSAPGNEFVTETSFGVFCDGEYYDLQSDSIHLLARIFFSVSLGFNIVALCFSWCSVWCLSPTKTVWQILSISSAIACVCSVPVFLLFEVEPCKDFRDLGQTCQMDVGSYFLLASVASSMLVAMFTQCLDPPEQSVCDGRNLTKQCWRSETVARDRRLARRERLQRKRLEQETLAQAQKASGTRGKWFKLNSEDGDEDSFEKVKNEHTYKSEDGDEESGFDSEQAVFQAPSPSKEFPILSSGLDVSSDDSGVAVDDHYSPDVLKLDRVLQGDQQYQRAPLPFLDELSHVSKEELLKKKKSSRRNSNDRNVPMFANMPALADDSAREGENETVKTDSYDDDDDDGGEDLGSLEPTVVEITGDESLLDRDGASTPAQDYGLPQQPLLEPASGSDTSRSKKRKKKKTLHDKLGGALANFDRSSSRSSHRSSNRRVLKGYRLMDDSNINSSLPYMSPPLEILTLNISQDDEDLELNYNDEEAEEMREFKDYIATTTNTEAVSPDVEPDPEPELDFSDEERAETPSSSDFEHAADPKPQTKEKKKKKRRSRKARNMYEYPSQSFASTSSLLSQTIEEETAEDLLDDSDQDNAFDTHPIRMGLSRSFSAPNLAIHSVARAVEELDMTGINQRGLQAEVLLTGTPTKKIMTSSHGGVPRVPRSSKSVRTTRTAEAPRTRQLPLFEEDRARWASNSDNDDETLPSKNSSGSERARQARVRRLRRSLSPAKVRLSRSLSPAKTHRYEPPSRDERAELRYVSPSKPPLPRSKSVPKRRLSTVPVVSPPSPHKPVERTDPAKSRNAVRTPKKDLEVNFDSVWNTIAQEEELDTSFDSGGYVIDMMDVTLAELSRPDGELKGPDEESV